MRGAEFIQLGAITLDSGTRPAGFAYNPARQLLAWAEGPSSKSVYVANLASPGRCTELKSDVLGFDLFLFSEEGNHLVAVTVGGKSFRVWNLETGQIVLSSDEPSTTRAFAARGRVLVTTFLSSGIGHAIGFYDLAHPDQPARREMVNSGP